MQYGMEFRNFLQEALDIMNERIRQGYTFQWVMDEKIEFNDTGYETFQIRRAKLYLLVREMSDTIVNSGPGALLADKLLNNENFISPINITTTDGQPVTDREALRVWINQIYLQSFVEKYISHFKYSDQFPTEIDEDIFRLLFDELISSLHETSVKSICLHPLWHFSSEENEVILSPEVRIRHLTSDERTSLYSLIKQVGSFSLLAIQNVKYGIEIAVDTPLSEFNSPLFDTFVQTTLDSLRLIHSGGVQAPLRFHTLLPTNRWRSISTGTQWGQTPNSYAIPEYFLTVADIEELKRNWGILVQGDIQSNKLLNRIKTRLNHLYASVDPIDRLVDSLIILESVFLDDSETTEITYKLSSRAAVFLEDDFNERKRTKSLIQQLYKLRSKLVHGSDIRTRDLRFNESEFTIHQFAQMAENITRKSVLKLIQTDQLLRQYDAKYFDDILLR